MKLEKALEVAKRILQETGLDQVTITVNGKPSQAQVELGDFIPENQWGRLLTIKTEEMVKSIGCYRDTGVVLK